MDERASLLESTVKSGVVYREGKRKDFTVKFGQGNLPAVHRVYPGFEEIEYIDDELNKLYDEFNANFLALIAKSLLTHKFNLPHDDFNAELLETLSAELKKGGKKSKRFIKRRTNKRKSKKSRKTNRRRNSRKSRK